MCIEHDPNQPNQTHPNPTQTHRLQYFVGLVDYKFDLLEVQCRFVICLCTLNLGFNVFWGFDVILTHKGLATQEVYNAMLLKKI